MDGMKTFDVEKAQIAINQLAQIGDKLTNELNYLQRVVNEMYGCWSSNNSEPILGLVTSSIGKVREPVETMVKAFASEYTESRRQEWAKTMKKTEDIIADMKAMFG